MDAHLPRKRGGQAVAVDGVVGAADRDRQHLVGARVGRLARRPPVALATVVVVVGHQLQATLLAQAQVGVDRVQVVITQRAALVVGIVDAVDATTELALGRITRARRAVGGCDGAVPVRCVDVPVPAQAAVQHVLGQVGVVGLAGARGGDERTEAMVADIPHGLGVELARGLVLVRRGPHVLVLVHAGDVGREAVDVTGVHAQVATALVVVTDGDTGTAAEFGGRVHREVLDGAAEVAGGGHAQRADALRQFGAGEVLGDQRAGDAQAVVIAVAVVAQRNAIERVAETALVEAAQADGLRFFVGAEGIVGLHRHAGQAVEDLLATGARRQHLLVDGGDALHLAGFALADDGHGVERLCAQRGVSGGIGGFSGMGAGGGKRDRDGDREVSGLHVDPLHGGSPPRLGTARGHYANGR